ncbi:MAG: hypothetical protein DRP54_07625 [Spirochaetes bacterium]|nr:MAG: hypothetical protein DRP54_07625 [Spirochaetota bacterium]
MDILDIVIYLIFFVVFGLNLVSIIMKIKAKRARGEPLVTFKRRFIKIPRDLYYYVKNVEATSGKPEAERLTGGIDFSQSISHNENEETVRTELKNPGINGLKKIGHDELDELKEDKINPDRAESG